MYLIFILSTIFVLASAADEKNVNISITDISNIIMEESQKGGSVLAALWDKKEKTDHESIDKFINELDSKVFERVKSYVVDLIKNSLGEAVTKPEKTDMYNVLRKIVKTYTTVLTMNKATKLTNNTHIKEDFPLRDGDDKLSKTIARLYDGIANKNVTGEDKSQLISESEKQIDNFIKSTINEDNKSKLKVASRSGSFFFNHHLQQQQQKSSSSLAHKLTHQLTSNMCAPQPVYINSCQQGCQPQCPHCQTGYGQSMNYGGLNGQHSSYGHISSSLNTGLSSNSLIGSGHISTGLLGSNDVSSSNYIGSGISSSGLLGSNALSSGNYIGSGHSSTGLVQSDLSSGNYIGSEHRSTGLLGSSDILSNNYLENGRSNTGLMGSNIGVNNYGSNFMQNSHNSHSLDTSLSSSLGSHNMNHYNTRGSGLSDVKGSYSGIANLWSLNKSNQKSAISGSTYGSTNLDSSRLGGNSPYDGSSYLGGNSYNQHTGGLSNMHGLGLGNVGSAGDYSKHYSASKSSKSSSSSKSDSSASHLSYGSSGNLW